MKLITSKIHFDLKTLIKKNFSLVKDLIKEQNKRINHVNIYHRDWEKQNCNDEITILKNEYNIDTDRLISLGFITSQVNCFDQYFHIDYNGTTETYFIPLINLDDLNGTEYVEFNDESLNINIVDKLIEITDLYNNRKDVEEELTKMGISKSEYEIKILNANKWGMVHMPYYLFHRGQSNKGIKDRTMFQIVLATKPTANVSNQVKINDSELDDDSDIINKLLISRSINEKKLNK